MIKNRVCPSLFLCLFFLVSFQTSLKVEAANSSVAVVIYDGEAHDGESIDVTDDMPSLGSMNKRLSSFKVSEGYKVRFFTEENFGGKYYTRSKDDKYPTDAQGFDNSVSSIKILSSPSPNFNPAEENSSSIAITIYDGRDLTGESLDIYASTASFGSMNKRLSSYKVTPGYQVRFFTEENYRGGYYTRNGDNPYEINAEGWDDKVSSVKILSAPEQAPEPSEPEISAIPYVHGETQVSNGDIVSYNGRCYSAKNNPGVWEAPAEGSWFWDLVDCNGAPSPDPEIPEPEIPAPELPSNQAPKIKFITPKDGTSINLNEIVSISVNAFDDDDNLSQVVIELDGQHLCDFMTSSTLQFRCDWTALVAGDIVLKATATDTDYSSASAEITLTVNDIEPPAPPTVPETAPNNPEIAGGLCKGFNVYPDWTQQTHAIGKDIMVHNNIAYSAIYWTNSIPGSDDSWAFHLNCDGSLPGSAPLLSLQNLSDPISLALPYWPNTLVVASTSSSAIDILEIESSTSENITDVAALSKAFSNVISRATAAEYSTIIIKSDALDKAISEKKLFNNLPVKAALTKAIELNQTDINSTQINSLSDDLKGWAEAHHLIIKASAPSANYGWLLNIGDFAYEALSGRRAVWDNASSFTAEILNELELYQIENKNRATFIAFNKSSGTRALSSDQWHIALEYIKQVTDYTKAPAILYSVPTNQATEYFMGATNADRQLRKAAYNNILGIFFDRDTAGLETKITDYQKAKVPLYSVGSASSANALTIIPELNSQLLAAGDAMDNEVFLFETPESKWVPSTVYKWADFLDGLNAMHNTGVAGNKYWLLDRNANNATNIKYAKVAIAAFLAQSMQETIRYNACDENNWSETRYGAPTDYPMSASCGQLGQKYADYGYNSTTGLDHPYSCPRDNKMEVSAATNAKWYGAPAPVFAVPDAVLKDMGLLVNGSAGRWTNEGHCNTVPETIDTSKQVWERDDCKVYSGQKAGKLVWDGSSRESVEGCGWWGRGVIQTTGRQNFGTLNHFLGRSHVNPDLIGKTIEGVRVEAPPANPLYPELDFCSDPGFICSSEQSKEIKWIAGLFYWVTSVQAYSNEGGPYSSWNYYTELKRYVDGGLQGTKFIDDVSGIVNRGCPDAVCETGEVHAIEERRENFRLVLEKLGLNPQ